MVMMMMKKKKKEKKKMKLKKKKNLKGIMYRSIREKEAIDAGGEVHARGCSFC